MASTPTAAIVVGGSAGALDALAIILPVLPADFAIPIALALHVMPREPSLLADVLGARCALSVREADDKEPVERGVYLASPDYHLLVEASRCFSLSVDEHVHFSRPSIDVLFESAAAVYGATLVGVLLSGANDDGARGLARVRAVGGITIVQDPATALVATMPESALALGCVDHMLPPAAIGPFLTALHAAASPRGRA